MPEESDKKGKSWLVVLFHDSLVVQGRRRRRCRCRRRIPTYGWSGRATAVSPLALSTAVAVIWAVVIFSVHDGNQ